jgi:hypothetical protein
MLGSPPQHLFGAAAARYAALGTVDGHLHTAGLVCSALKVFGLRILQHRVASEEHMGLEFIDHL